MRTNTRSSALARAWTPVLAWFDTADARCPCKAIVAPLVADWQAFAAEQIGDATDADLDRQLAALQTAIGTIQKYAVDVADRTIAPGGPAADAALRRGIADLADECPEGAAYCTPLAGDPPLRGAEPPDLFSGITGLLGSAAGTAGAASGTSAGQAAAEQVRAAIPQIAEDVKQQIPALAEAGGKAAAPVVAPIAERAGTTAGEAAGKAAVKSAKDSAWDGGWGTGAKVAGTVVVLGILGGIIYAATRKGRR